MSDNPFVLSIVGISDSGKTTLILKLVPELRKKGYKVAVAKHCPRGFDLDVEGKDSYRFSEAGSDGTFLSSPEGIAFMRPKDESFDLRKDLEKLFAGFDIVLMEGYNDETGMKKIQIIRKGVGGSPLLSDDLIAYISDMQLDTNKPIYDPNDIPGIVNHVIARSAEGKTSVIARSPSEARTTKQSHKGRQHIFL